MSTRVETDSMGTMHVPADALYGAQTARAVENFPVSGWRMPREFIAALGWIKQAAAVVNARAGRLDQAAADAVQAAAQEVIEGRLDGQFVVDVFQTGSGTSTNMNANEVIANRACQHLGQAGVKAVHPNDHVNMSQSSNDVIPTALHVSAALALHQQLAPALRKLQAALEEKVQGLDDVVKIGRTHLMDAVPIRLGQEFSGYAAQIRQQTANVQAALAGLCPLAIGGTAVGTGLNAVPGFAGAVCDCLKEHLHLPFREADNHFAAQATADAAVFASSMLRGLAISLGKIASDIRLMGSGPRCGLGELHLPPTQPGSSIMPGKVNPVICESVIQVACWVVGADAAVAAGATGGVGSILELNVALPLIAYNLLTSIRLLSNVINVFVDKCLAGLTADADRCRDLIEQSLAMVTVLAPRLGYDRCADLAKQAHATGKTIRQIVLEQKLIPQAELDELLDARKQTGG